MAANIGSTSVAITANSSQFDTAVTMAMNRFKAFESLVGNFKTGNLAAGARSLMDMGQQLSQNLNANSLISAMGSMPGWVGVGGQAVGILKEIGAAYLEMAKRGADLVSQQVRMAREFSMTTQAAAGLRLAAERRGVDFDTLNAGMARFARHLGDAREGSEEARQSFEALGLDWRLLHSLPVDQAMLRVADSVNTLGNASDRAHHLQQMFGRGFREMLPLLSRGSGFVEQSRGMATMTGEAPSTETINRIREHNAELREIRAVVASFSRGRDVDAADSAFTRLWEGANNGATMLLSNFGSIRRILGGDLIGGVAAATPIRPPEPSGGAFFQGIVEQARQMVEVNRLAVEDMDRQWAAFDERQRERAGEMVRAAQSPWERFQATMDEINNNWELTGDEWRRLAATAMEQLDRSSPGQGEARFANVMEAGSAAAVSAINRFQFGEASPSDPASRLLDIQQRALALQQQQTDDGRRVIDALRDMARPAIAPPFGA